MLLPAVGFVVAIVLLAALAYTHRLPRFARVTLITMTAHVAYASFVCYRGTCHKARPPPGYSLSDADDLDDILNSL